MTNEHIEKEYQDIKRHSEEINDRLWYVNPENIKFALTSAYNAGLERAKEVAHGTWFPKDKLGEEYFVDVLPEELISSIEKEKIAPTKTDKQDVV